MKFAKIVFVIAGVYGLFSLLPLYFLFDYIGRQDPPPITHPQFFYGFLGVALAFQLVFLVIAADPARFRPMMLPSVLEKLSYVAAISVLYGQNRVTIAQAMTAVPDSLFCVLFVIALFKTPSTASASQVWIPNVRIP